MVEKNITTIDSLKYIKNNKEVKEKKEANNLAKQVTSVANLYQ